MWTSHATENASQPCMIKIFAPAQTPSTRRHADAAQDPAGLPNVYMSADVRADLAWQACSRRYTVICSPMAVDPAFVKRLLAGRLCNRPQRPGRHPCCTLHRTDLIGVSLDIQAANCPQSAVSLLSHLQQAGSRTSGPGAAQASALC